jgi:hypothetical protein
LSLHGGFLSGLQLEDAAEGINVFTGGRLEDMRSAFCPSFDASSLSA